MNNTIQTLLNDDRTKISFYTPTFVDNVCKIVKVYDGDTVHGTVLIQAPPIPVKLSFRLNGINSGEIKSKNPEEKLAGYAARDALTTLIPPDTILTCSNISYDKYGRILCDLHKDDINISQWMLDHKHATTYDGGHKEEWKPI